MEHITYRAARKDEDNIVRVMMHQFYSNDTISDQKITNTLAHLHEFPLTGSVLLIESNNEVIGYSLLINFWSNEYGGNMIIIDELYIVPPHRNKGIGSKFITYLKESKYNDLVALELEVLPYNVRALEWYKNLGFQTSDRTFMTMVM